MYVTYERQHCDAESLKVKHEGEATGELKKIGDGTFTPYPIFYLRAQFLAPVETYFAYPESKNPEQGILM